MDYLKIYNGDPVDLKVKVEDTYILLPAKGYAIVSNLIGFKIQKSYAQLEVSPATLEEYKEYRVLKEKAEIELAKKEEERKKVSEKQAKEEAKKIEAKIATREIALKEIREEELKAKIAVINNEKDSIEKLKETVVESIPNNSLEEVKTSKKGKKGKNKMKR